MTSILDGAKLSASLREEMKKRIKELGYKGLKPKLSIILVGRDPPSVVYTTKKKQACMDAGIETELIELPEDTEEQKLVDMLEDISHDDRVHGVLVQLPLPARVNEMHVLEAIPPGKDVDGLSPENLGRLLTGDENFVPCTPKGIMRLLEAYGISLEGKRVVIINRSNLLGKPLAFLMLRKNATVTVCHSKTRDISSFTKDADIVVTGTGQPGFLKADMIKKGAVIVDAGIKKIGERVLGDADFESIGEKASFITPVPGGVGPMTVAMVLENTIMAAERSMR